jgi:mRNA interferase MazF
MGWATMLRGDILWADLEPVRGSEADKRRPVVIVSNDGANAMATRLGRGLVAAVPVTTSTRRVQPFQVLLKPVDTGLRFVSKAQAEQIRAIDIERLGDHIGTLPPDVMDELDEALRLHLGL